MDLVRIQSIVTPKVEALGYRVVVTEIAGRRHAPVLRVIIEHEDEEARISLDDCVRVSRALGEVPGLDALFPGSYHLEVSSPGLERRLVGERDFRRFTGKRARIWLAEPREGRRRFTGKIAGVRDRVLQLDMGGTTGLIVIRMDEISRATLKPEYADLFANGQA